MSRVGLSEKEEIRLLSLFNPEGDISDVELDFEEEDEPDIENLRKLLNPISQDFLSESTEEVFNNADSEDEWDEEDLLPLSNCVHKERRDVNTRLLWKKKDINKTDTTCDILFEVSNELLTPLDYFKTFFDDEIIKNLVEQTNLYSVQKEGHSINTTFQEMCQFIGIQIISGIVQMPSYRMYWARETRFSPIADVMSRNRFDKMRNNLHISDNTEMKKRNEENYDKLFKVRPLIEKLRSNFGKIDPEEYNCIYEIMIPFKGKSSLKQYIKSKPHKWGIKMFARAGISGIVYDFEIYVGKDTVKESTKLGISGDIVVRLVEKVPKHKNFKVLFDNWFTSYSLLCHLKKMGILSAGTVRIDRVPQCQLKSDSDLKKEGRGSFDFRTESSSNITVTKWFDNKSVHVISTYEGVEPVETVRRWSSSEKKYIEIRRPKMIEEYNLHMGGVDLNDMLVALYRIKSGVKRYYLRIVYHLIDICIVNSWLLYRRHMENQNEKPKRLVTFRSEIANGLMQYHNNPIRKRPGRPSASNSPSNSCRSTPEPPAKRLFTFQPIDDIRYDGVGHWPGHIEPKKTLH